METITEKGINGNAQKPGLISVILPVYNAEKYLCQCLESVLRQSYKLIEIILVDDGSNDKSASISEGYALADSRVKVIHTPNNGPAAARNIGIKKSTGDFIFFMDADDYLEDSALELLIESYRLSEADLVIGDFKKNNSGPYASGHERFFSESRLLTRKDIIIYTEKYLKKPNRFPLFVYSWGRLFKSAIIKNNNIFFNCGLRTFEDVAFNFDYLCYAQKMFFLKKVIYTHLVHDNYSSASMSLGANPQSLFGYRDALVSAASFLKSYATAEDIKRNIGHAYVCYTIIQLIRTCGQINAQNKRIVYQLVREMISAPRCRESLAFYAPSKGDSRIIPFLIRLGLTWPVVLVCRYKARRRYNKGRING